MVRRFKCWLFGHRWKLQPYENAPEGWFFEHHKCSRCGARRRDLVASQIG